LLIIAWLALTDWDEFECLMEPAADRNMPIGETEPARLLNIASEESPE
jgi:hypothetical protein